jgi:hypothetical protein
MIPRVPLRQALSDPNLLGTALAGDSWSSWRILSIAAMGEELSADERVNSPDPRTYPRGWTGASRGRHRQRTGSRSVGRGSLLCTTWISLLVQWGSELEAKGAELEAI